MLVDLKEDALAAAADGMRVDSEAVTVAADVSDLEQVKAYVRKAMDSNGRIGGFFNQDGIEGKQNATEDYGAEKVAKVGRVNLNGVFYGMAEVLKVMRGQGSESIVNTASVGGIRGVGNQSGYAATKHGAAEPAAELAQT